jgi:hypothetical protein
MLYDYKVAVKPVFYAWAADIRVIVDEGNNTVCCGEHRGILCNYEINCISQFPNMRWRGYSIDSLQLILWDRQRIVVDGIHAIALSATPNPELILLCLIVIFDQKFQLFLKQTRSVLYISLAMVVWM